MRAREGTAPRCAARESRGPPIGYNPRRMQPQTEAPLLPALKWAGGKRWLAPVLARMYQPYRRERLVEPFCGGLAVTLALAPDRALLNDINPHVINFYRHLQKGLRMRIAMRNDRELFYAHREEFNRLIKGRGVHTAKAAQLFYFLNRTCFNGLCRFNRSGEFNVPFGSYTSIRYRRDLSAYAPVLSRWELTQGDFAQLTLRPGDFVYADPPYDVTFRQYSADGFAFSDQERLAQWLAGHHGPVVLSNQATTRIVELYADLGFTLQLLDAPRAIACTGDRRPVREVLATRNVTPLHL